MSSRARLSWYSSDRLTSPGDQSSHAQREVLGRLSAIVHHSPNRASKSPFLGPGHAALGLRFVMPRYLPLQSASTDAMCDISSCQPAGVVGVPPAHENSLGA
ncbi:MAG: hypothetical protein IPG67_18340 [Acidobacteria bacterium]|nr:hypothetical protein [Acidobacteriota bacterium]